jgi:pancreatic triacylglycerol lipase
LDLASEVKHSENFLNFSSLQLSFLEAHVAGMTGKNVRGGRIGTIVGLDPAGPLFSVNNPSQRLASGDAIYVEAIHTNGRANGIGGEELSLAVQDSTDNFCFNFQL